MWPLPQASGAYAWLAVANPGLTSPYFQYRAIVRPTRVCPGGRVRVTTSWPYQSLRLTIFWPRPARLLSSKMGRPRMLPSTRRACPQGLRVRPRGCRTGGLHRWPTARLAAVGVPSSSACCGESRSPPQPAGHPPAPLLHGATRTAWLHGCVPRHYKRQSHRPSLSKNPPRGLRRCEFQSTIGGVLRNCDVPTTEHRRWCQRRTGTRGAITTRWAHPANTIVPRRLPSDTTFIASKWAWCNYAGCL